MGDTSIPRTKPKAPRPNHWMLYLLAAIGVIAGVFLREPVVDLFREKPADPVPVKIRLPADAKKIATERAEPSLEWADEQSLKAVGDNLASLSAFFDEVKERTPHFAGDVLSFRNKRLIALDALPKAARAYKKWRDNLWVRVSVSLIPPELLDRSADLASKLKDDRSKEFMRERFGALLFTSSQLAQSVELVIKGYTASVQSTDGEMLVKIRADIADLPLTSLPAFTTKEGLEKAFASAIEEAASRAQVDLRNDVIRELASTIAGEVLTMVAVKLGVSAGILSAGAASSWATFGVGLVAGVIVDQAVSWVWNWWSDPVGDLSKMMNQKLDEMHRLIVDGDGTKPGLRAKLLELHEKRKNVRHQAISDLIEGKVTP